MRYIILTALCIILMLVYLEDLIQLFTDGCKRDVLSIILIILMNLLAVGSGFLLYKLAKKWDLCEAVRTIGLICFVIGDYIHVITIYARDRKKKKEEIEQSEKPD